MRVARRARPLLNASVVKAPSVQILVAESGPIQSQLLARALRATKHFKVDTVTLEAATLHQHLQAHPAEIVLLAGHPALNFGLLRWLHISHPGIAPILLIDGDDRDLIVNAFRSGVRGIFPFTHAPFRMLCKCIDSVARGEIWINHQQMNYLLTALSEVNTLRVVSSAGKLLLTPREEQVVALVADGLTNRAAGNELGLSEHTIKKYLLRIFDKLGISTRVELVLYVVSHGENRQAEWMPGRT